MLVEVKDVQESISMDFDCKNEKFLERTNDTEEKLETLTVRLKNCQTLLKTIKAKSD